MEELIYKAKLAEQAERSEEMVRIVKQIIDRSDSVDAEKRNLLSVAYKTVVSNRRSAWRQISQIEMKEESRGNPRRVQLARALREKIEEELNHYCGEVCRIADQLLESKERSEEGRVFLLKLKGDYYRYLAEFQTAPNNVEKYGQTSADNAQRSYQAAIDEATKSNLPPTNPTRLGLALNFSVFYYEVRN